jgi:hypothetical protein
MDVSGVTGTAWRGGEVVGEFVLKGGRTPVRGGRVVEHVEIRFPGFVAREVGDALRRLRDANVSRSRWASTWSSPTAAGSPTARSPGSGAANWASAGTGSRWTWTP